MRGSAEAIGFRRGWILFYCGATAFTLCSDKNLSSLDLMGIAGLFWPESIYRFSLDSRSALYSRFGITKPTWASNWRNPHKGLNEIFSEKLVIILYLLLQAHL
jgi:hypothetical protein